MPTQCQKVKEVSDLMTKEPTIEVLVYGSHNYNGPKGAKFLVGKSYISYIGKQNDPSSSRLINDNGSGHINVNPFYSIHPKISIQQLIRQRHRQKKKEIKILFVRY